MSSTHCAAGDLTVLPVSFSTVVTNTSHINEGCKDRQYLSHRAIAAFFPLHNVHIVFKENDHAIKNCGNHPMQQNRDVAENHVCAIIPVDSLTVSKGSFTGSFAWSCWVASTHTQPALRSYREVKSESNSVLLFSTGAIEPCCIV